MAENARGLMKTGGDRLQEGIAAGLAAGVAALVWHKLSVPFALSVLVGLAVLLMVCYAMRKYNQSKRKPDRNDESVPESRERGVT
ncbi:hypothetical protein [Candidatus Poriferisocius sp.]|uniref:hypothetical protein n=1 Tax=Candidatus Poriferisocius sp. TaxID=3101276 RepID=UPI003B02BCB8